MASKPNPASLPLESDRSPAPRSLRTVCYSIVADADVNVMPRVLGLFSKLNVVPDRWYSTRVGPRGEELHIDCQVTGLSEDQGRHIAHSMRGLLPVHTVLIAWNGLGAE